MVNSKAGIPGARGTIRKLRQPKQRESGNRTALCPSTGQRLGGVTPEKFFPTYGQICILSHFLSKMTCKTSKLHAVVDMRLGKIFSIYHMMYDVVLTNHNIINAIFNIHPIIIVLEETNTKGNVVTRDAAIF